MVEFTEKKATRNAYGDGLLALGETNPNVVFDGLDLTESTVTHTF